VAVAVREGGVRGPCVYTASDVNHVHVARRVDSVDWASGPVYTERDVNVLRHQYEHKSAKKHVMWRRLSSRHARTHCVRNLWSDQADCTVGESRLKSWQAVVHRCTGGGEAAYAGFSRELTGLPSLDPSGAVVRSLLVQSFLRKSKDANGIFLSKHVHVREILKKFSRT